MSTFQASHIETNVQKAIVKKIQALNRLDLSDDKETNFFSTAKTLEPTDNQNPLEYHLVRNTLCRLSVDIPVEGEEKNKVLFFSSYITPGSERYGKKTQANRHLTFNKNPFTKDKNFIWRGEAGITGVQVTQKSFFVKQLTVNWTCPDPNDFEKIIKPAFLKHGRFMVLEFGWGISGKGESFPEITTNNMADYMTNLRERNAKSVESYQAECGIVTNYGYDVNEQGGYSGTITITSRGDNVLGTTIQNTDKDETVTRYTPINSPLAKKRAENITTTFKEVIENLTGYAREFATINYTGGEKLTTEDDEMFNKGALQISQGGIFDENVGRRIGGTYVSWGWFEDHILNSFFKIDVSTKTRKTKIPFQEFRSVYTLPELDNKSKNTSTSNTLIPGLPSEISQDLINQRGLFSDDDDTQIFFPNLCNNVVGVYSLGLDSIILPGQNIPPKVIEDLDNEIQRFADEDTKSNKAILDELRGQRKILTKTIISYKMIDKFFKPFGNPEESYGTIRNIVFNTEFLASKFEGINSVQEGISNLFGEVSGKYGGFFKFGLHQDENNNGRIGVVDFNYQNDLEKSKTLLIENNTLDFTKWIEGRQSLSDKKMWRFGLFSKDSIIKDFSLSLQLTKEAATLAMYGTGVNGQFINQSSLPDLGIERFAALSNSEIYKKIHPSGSTTLAQEKNRINEVVINDFSSPVDGTVDTTGLSIEDYLSEGEGKLVDSELPFDIIHAVSTRITEVKEKQKGHFIKDANLKIGYDSNGGMGEDTKRKMISQINYSDVTTESSNFQLNKTIIPIELTMTIDGVGGLRPGNLFRVDYLPKIYRKYTYFQIFTIGHTINTSGWSTSIGAKMKLDFPKMIEDGLIQLQERKVESESEQQTLPTSIAPTQTLDESISEIDNEREFINQIGSFTTANAESTAADVDPETYTRLVNQVDDGSNTLDAFLQSSPLSSQLETETIPEAPPRPIIPTIDDPYDEELVTDFVIQETTLDDFEPWESPAPFVPAEDGNTEVEISTGDVSVYTEKLESDEVKTTKVKQEKVKVKVKKKEPNTTRTYTEEELAIPTTIEEIKEKFGSTLSFVQDSGEYFINNKKVSQFEYMVVERVYKDYFNEFVGYTAL